MFGGCGRRGGGGPIPPQSSPKGTSGAGGKCVFPDLQGKKIASWVKLRRKTVHTHFLVDKALFGIYFHGRSTLREARLFYEEDLRWKEEKAVQRESKMNCGRWQEEPSPKLGSNPWNVGKTKLCSTASD